MKCISCNRKALARKRCSRHYSAWYRKNFPELSRAQHRKNLELTKQKRRLKRDRDKAIRLITLLTLQEHFKEFREAAEYLYTRYKRLIDLSADPPGNEQWQALLRLDREWRQKHEKV